MIYWTMAFIHNLYIILAFINNSNNSNWDLNQIDNMYVYIYIYIYI